MVSGTALVNTAYVDSANLDTNTSNNTDTASTVVTAEALVNIVKDVIPAAVEPGMGIVYRMVVTNAGPSTARNVVVADTLPPEVINAAVSSSQGGCTGFPCTLDDIDPGSSATIFVVGTVADGADGDFTNTASLTSDTAFVEGSTTSDDATATATTVADLTLEKEAPATAVAGGSVVYTLTVRNLGPSTAQAVTVVDVLPAGMSFASAGAGCGESGGTVTCTAETLAAGATALYTIAVDVAGDIEPGTSIENRAVVASDTADPDPSNNTGTADTSIVSIADLVVSKAGPASVVAGERITYTIVVTNVGSTVAQAVDIKDTLPAEVTLVSASVARSGSGPAACGATVCQVGDMAAGEVVTITVVGTVSPDAGEEVTNRATIFSDSPLVDTATTSATVTTAVTQQADLVITKSDLPDPVGPAEGLLYRSTVVNRGPSTAQGVVITDTLDNNVSFSSADAACAHDGSEIGGVITCTVGTLAPETSAFYLVAVTVGDVPAGTLLPNVANVTSSTPLVNTADDSIRITTTVAVPVGPSADVSIEKTTAAASVIAGEQITYTLAVANSGPQPATNVRVLELAPAGTEIVTMTVSNGADISAYCSLGGSCYVGTVPSSGNATITVVLEVEAGYAGSSLVNSAQVSADQRDADPSDNISQVSTPVSVAADLVMAKNALANPVYAGQLLMYELVVTNTGPSDATGVVITDAVPANTSFAGASAGCYEAEGLITCEVGELAAGAGASYLVQVRVNSGITNGASIVNTAYVTSPVESDPNDNESTATVTALQSTLGLADMTIGKSNGPDPVTAGELLTYTLVVTNNNGPAVATDVSVVDLLPAGVAFVSVAPTQGLCNGGVSCQLGDLAVGASATITVVVRVDSDTPAGDVTNNARVSAANPDPTPGNNRASATTTVEVDDTLGIAKVGPATIAPNQAIAYQIVVSNSGSERGDERHRERHAAGRCGECDRGVEPRCVQRGGGRGHLRRGHAAAGRERVRGHQRLRGEQRQRQPVEHGDGGERRRPDGRGGHDDDSGAGGGGCGAGHGEHANGGRGDERHRHGDGGEHRAERGEWCGGDHHAAGGYDLQQRRSTGTAGMWLRRRATRSC